MMYFVLNSGSRVFAKASQMLRSVASRFEPADLQRRKVVESTQYDMTAGVNEAYYGDRYWSLLEPHFEGIEADAVVTDLGCGQGRLSLRMAKRFPRGKVTGCDLSPTAITRAREQSNTVRNITYVVKEIADFLSDAPAGSADVVVMTEVTFFYPKWREALPGIFRHMKPGAVLIMSFRSQYFYALATVRGRFWYDAAAIVKERRGRLAGGGAELTWQTSQEVRDILGATGFEVLDLAGIGVCSGIAGDPHDFICQPEDLDDAEIAQLVILEEKLARSVVDGGRYILAVARKRQ